MTKEDQDQLSAEESVIEQDTHAVEPTTAQATGETQGAVDLSDVIDVTCQDEPLMSEVDELEALRTQLTEAQNKANEYLDGWQRARAEFVNYKRRDEQRRKQMDFASKSKVLANLLPALDDLDRAFDAIPEDIRDNPWIEGVSLVEHKLQAALKRSGVSVVPVDAGDAFDPNYHEAVTHEPSKDFEQGQIIQVVQRGYTLDDTVFRPALVRVSNGKLDNDQ
jgi:molecular chaperone GrpE